VYLPVPRPRNNTGEAEADYDLMEWSTNNLPNNSAVMSFDQPGSAPDVVFLDTPAIKSFLDPRA